MSWDDYTRRRAALKAVLTYAEQHPSEGLPFDVLPEVAACFRDRRELLLALQYDWSQALWGRIEVLALEGNSGTKRLPDASDIAQQAWTDCAAARPVLRRLLDAHREEIAPAASRERGIMTTAALGNDVSQKVYRSPYVA